MLYRVLVGFAVLAVASPCAAQDTKPDVKTKLEGHRGGVTALAFAPDGSTVATGSGNGLVRLWDAKTGEVIAKLDPMGGTKVVHVGFSADGKTLSAAARKAVITWGLADPTKPKEMFTDNYSESVYKIGGVSGDGRRCYHYDTSSSVLRYYDLKDGAGSTDLKGTKLLPLAFGAIPDPESGLAAVLCHDAEKKAGVLAFVGLGDKWQLSDGLKVPDANPNSVGFAPDGKWLVVCSGGEVMVWRVPGSQKVNGKPRAINPIAGTV